MKLSDWAKKQGICYKTAWRWWKLNMLNAYQLQTGTIIIDENSPFLSNKVVSTPMPIEKLLSRENIIQLRAYLDKHPEFMASLFPGLIKKINEILDNLEVMGMKPDSDALKRDIIKSFPEAKYFLFPKNVISRYEHI